jgi:hypothetical protein
MSHARAWIVAAVVLAACEVAHSAAPADRDAVFTLYAARLARERTWQRVLTRPGQHFMDAYFVAGAIAKPYAAFRNDSVRLEAEGQLALHFGVQSHWEMNAVPIVVRWRDFSWSERYASSFAFGLGYSYATELPRMEISYKGRSGQSRVHWFAEIAVGPRDSRWSTTLRLHHRSSGYGLLGDYGGMNAVGFGLRMRFGGYDGNVDL